VVLYRTFRHSLVTAITLLFPEETAGIPEAFLPTVSLIGCISTPPSPGQVTIAIVSSPKTDLLSSLAGLEDNATEETRGDQIDEKVFRECISCGLEGVEGAIGAPGLTS